MEERLREFETYRASVCKKANILLWSGIGLVLLGVILLVSFESPIFLIFIIAGIILLIIQSSKRTKLSTEFKNSFIIELVNDTYPGCIYRPKVGIQVSRMLEAGIFQKPDRQHLEDYVSASFNDIPFEMCQFDFKERRETRDARGNRRVSYVTYAKGRFMIFDFKRDFNKIVKVVQNVPSGMSLSRLEKIETESIEFNKKFKVYATDGLTAFYVLTPQIQIKMLELETKFGGSIYFVFKRGKLYVAITDGVNILDVNASKKITLETLNSLRSQLLLPAAIINELGLSTEKFNLGDAI